MKQTHSATKTVTIFFGGKMMKSLNNQTSTEVLQYQKDSNLSLKLLHRFLKVKTVFTIFNRALALSAAVERHLSFWSVILQDHI